MGRKSALTAKQWKDIEVRFYAGESASALAREYGISEAAIRKRFGARKCEAKALSIKIVEFENDMKGADLGTKILARTYADKILAMQELSSDVGINGLSLAKRIGDALNKVVENKKDGEILDEGAMRQLMTAGMTINTHSKIGMDMMIANAKQPRQPLDDNGAALLSEIAVRLPN
jgi:hypothetical protein